ncbi:MAG: response regulator transcription factor [Bifidobacteriaceae bacterium]|jgi:DNA-binding NarL/FixJ family response regulator|nr:response regulator transcription factor [Bifidobacteriaceae bacterium]
MPPTDASHTADPDARARPAPEVRVKADPATPPKRRRRTPASARTFRTITVLVADDHPIVRKALVDLLAQEPDMQVVGVAATGEEAVRVALETAPDVVMMDLKMPGRGGIWAIRQILSDAAGSGRATKVVAVTASESDALVAQAVKAGVAGYIVKASAPEVFAATVRRVATGHSQRSTEVAVALSRAERRPSKREVEVLRLAAEGLSNKEIAERIGVAQSTVKTLLSRMYRKLGVRGRSHAVREAISREWI